MNCAYLMCDIVVDKRLHGVLEVKDMQDGYFAIKSIPSTYRRDYGAVLITVCFEFWKR